MTKAKEKEIESDERICIEIPGSLAKWLKSVTRELSMEPESFIVRILWQYYDVAKASERVSERVGDRNDGN